MGFPLYKFNLRPAAKRQLQDAILYRKGLSITAARRTSDTLKNVIREVQKAEHENRGREAADMCGDHWEYREDDGRVTFPF